ncbi:MAG TPA: DinB family protein, partial [Pyrinomonadaceae bacterium]|nr:DinB family protein [Pyrinomonadaceae bacterium]
LKAAAELPDEDLRRDFKISHRSIFATLLHMAGVEWIWLERWQGRSPAGKDAWSFWTTDSCADLATLHGRWSDVADRRAEFIGALDESRLMAKLPFTLLNGDSDSLPLVGQMQHVVNHATLHRGQVVGMIRQLGIAPPATDLLFYLRREIPA